jgi:hypothetical protein
MRYFSLILIVCLLCGLATGPAWAQQLQCDPCSYAFNKVPIGNSSSFTFQLSNTGNKILRISSMSVQGNAFSLGEFPLPAHIKPGASVVLPVIFTPTVLGHTFGILTLISNATVSPPEMNVSGNGVGKAMLGVSPATLSFGNVTVGSSATLGAKFTASDASVTISSDQSTSSEFAILGLHLPITIQAGKSLPVRIRFTPNASGKASGKAGFISNAADSPTVEQLTGMGVAQSSHSVNLSWDSGDGSAVGYNVYCGHANGGPYQIINTALDASTNYTDYSVVSGTTYYYVVTKVNALGEESAYSNVTEAVIPKS